MKRYRIIHNHEVWGQWNDLDSAIQALIKAWAHLGNSYSLYDYEMHPPEEVSILAKEWM
jgi:hypothetical protein